MEMMVHEMRERERERGEKKNTIDKCEHAYIHTHSMLHCSYAYISYYWAMAGGGGGTGQYCMRQKMLPRDLS